MRWLPDGNIDFLERIDNQVPAALRSPFHLVLCLLAADSKGERSN